MHRKPHAAHEMDVLPQRQPAKDEHADQQPGVAEEG